MFCVGKKKLMSNQLNKVDANSAEKHQLEMCSLQPIGIRCSVSRS